VLTPTRKLALQVAEAFNTLTPAKLPPRCAFCDLRRRDFRDQIGRLKRGVQVVVGTPAGSWFTCGRERSTSPDFASPWLLDEGR